MEVRMMSFPIPTRPSQLHTESTLVRSKSSFVGADTKSDRLVLSSSATVSVDDWSGSWKAELRSGTDHQVLLPHYTTAEKADDHQ